MIFRINREEFISSITSDKKDSFAKKFVEKCDRIKKWDCCFAYKENDILMGAIVIAVSKNKPYIGRLQLLHTFAKFRGKGVGSKLCDFALRYASNFSCDYFRVCSEIDAIPFYTKYGFDFVGKQKSQTQVIMFRLTSPEIKKNNFDLDEVIYKDITRKGKGACVELFKQYTPATIL